MSEPEITVLIYTARDDYPYAGKAAGWHCFEPFLRTLADQTFKDFELVLVDALWETRPDWFRDRPQPFPVKHVPTTPNYWQARGRVGLATQINRGFVWADGRYVWMGAENNLYPPHHLERVSSICRAGKVPVAWYGVADRGYPYANTPAGHGAPDGATVEVTGGHHPDVSFSLHGFTPEDLLTMDHRASRFVDDRSLVVSPCHHQHYFGYSSVPLDVAVAVNGFDELMDGVKALQDCDFGDRIVRRGCDLVMHRDLYVVEPPTKQETGKEVGYGGGIRNQDGFQCNYAILLHNQLTGRLVNTALPPGYAEDVQARVCRGACPIQDKCRGGTIGESALYPFCEGELAGMARDWHRDAPAHLLSADRELRKARRSPYDVGFVQP
jgi:hypothetical protein